MNIDKPPVTSSTTAKILTRDVLPKLTGYLDASDVVECYAVTRMAKLKTPPVPTPKVVTNAPTPGPTAVLNDEINESNTTIGDANNSYSSSPEEEGGTLRRIEHRIVQEGGGSALSPPSTAAQTSVATEVIMVQKSALAFRYKALNSQDPDSPGAKKPFELTLEYGPQRTGVDMESEAMPIVEGGASEEEGKFVSWNNEGKIYYETPIDPNRWDTANFMAPITGAVLSKILDYALDYTTQAPRYQPFEVYDVAQDMVIIHSSSSDDFVWNLFGRLASLNVNLRPLLFQPQRKVRLYVNTSLDEQMQEHSDSTGDPSGTFHDDGEGTDMVVSPPTSASNKVVQRIDAVFANQAAAEFLENFYRCGYALRNGEFDAALVDEDAEPIDNVTDTTHEETLLNRTSDGLNDGGAESEGSGGIEDSAVLLPPPRNDSTPQNDYVTTEFDSASDSTSSKNDTSATSAPQNKTHTKKHDNNTRALRHSLLSSPLSSLELSPRDALLSGDGRLVTSTLAPCFSLPQYAISNVVYLYIDGVNYYKVNLTQPFWETLDLVEPLPTPFLVAQGRGDALDWSLALLIVGGFAFGVYLILVQSGIVRPSRSLRINGCLQKFFRSEHVPPADSQYTSLNPGNFRPTGGSAYPGESISMSGREQLARRTNSAVNYMEQDGSLSTRCISPFMETQDSYYDDYFEEDETDCDNIELKDSPTHGMSALGPGSADFIFDGLVGDDFGADINPSIGASTGSGSYHGSSHSYDNLSLDDKEILLGHSMRRDANLVERADLTSNSKVAVPVSIADRVAAAPKTPLTPRIRNVKKSPTSCEQHRTEEQSTLQIV